MEYTSVVGRFVRSLCQQRHGLHDRRRCRHHRAAHLLRSGAQSLRLHDAAQENAADSLLCVLCFEHAKLRHDVFADGHLTALQRFSALLHSRAVPCQNDGKLRPDRRQHLRVMNDAGAVAAVRAADQKKNVRVHALNRLQIILRQFKRKLPDNLCARAETCQPCSLHRQLRHKSADHHPQSARRRGAGKRLRKRQRPRLRQQRIQCFLKADAHVFGDRRIRLCCAENSGRIQINGSQLCIGTAKIRQ